jgi:hypothetical protein
VSETGESVRSEYSTLRTRAAIDRSHLQLHNTSGSNLCFTKDLTAVYQSLMNMATESAHQHAHLEPSVDLDAVRCPICQRHPVDGVHLPCGHVYCKYCRIDMQLTAELVNGIAQCKSCGFVLAVYQPFPLHENGRTMTTVSELVQEARDNPKAFSEWVRTSSVFQCQPQPFYVEEQSGAVQQGEEQAAGGPGGAQTHQVEHHITGQLAQRRLTNDSSSPRLPIPQGQPLPLAVPLPNNIPIDPTVGDGFTNNLLGQGNINLNTNLTDYHQGFGQLQPSGRTPSMARTTSATNIQLAALDDELLFDQEPQMPDSMTPQELAVIRGEWEGKQKELRQELEQVQAEARVIDARLEKMKIAEETGVAN